MEKNTPLPEQNGNTPASDKANASSTPSFLVSEEEEKALQERNEEKALAKTISKMYNIVISTVVLNILDIKYVYNNNQEVNYGCT